MTGVQTCALPILGADSYQSASELATEQIEGVPPIGIGEGSVLDGVIIDKNCRLGRGVNVSNTRPLTGTDSRVVVQDGIIVVSKGTTLPNGWQS